MQSSKVTNSPLILWLVQFRLVSEEVKLDWNTGMA